MITSTNAEKVFDKILHLFIILNKKGREGNFFILVKDIY
jgi:hypothetical protein